MTVADLIRASMRKLGCLAAGEQPSATEAADVLESLNAMLESWNLERLYVFSITPNQYTLVPGKQKYTIGPGGDFNAPRPNAFDQAYVVYPSGSTPPVEIPIEILNTDQWAAIQVKTTTSTFPTKMYADMDNPLCGLFFWPVPQVGLPVNLYTWGQIASFPNINQTIVLPPGYARALIYNLAVEIAPDFEREITTALATIAAEAKGNIKRINMPTLLMTVDSALIKGPRGGWNYQTGEYQFQ